MQCRGIVESKHNALLTVTILTLTFIGCADAEDPVDPGAVDAMVVAPGQGAPDPHNKPAAFFWRRYHQDGPKEVLRPAVDGINANKLARLGFRPLPFRFEKRPRAEQAKASTAALLSNVADKLVTFTRASSSASIRAYGEFTRSNADGSAVYSTRTTVTSGSVDQMSITLWAETADYESVHKQWSPSGGILEWAREFFIDQCQPEEDVMAFARHYGHDSSGSVLATDTSGDAFGCGTSGSGGGSGNDDLFLDGTYDSGGGEWDWTCDEFNLSPGTWHVYVDDSFAGTADCDK